MHPSHRGPRMGCGQGSPPPNPPPPQWEDSTQPLTGGEGCLACCRKPCLSTGLINTHSFWASVGRIGREPGESGHRTPFSVLIKRLDTPPMHECFHLQYWKVGNTLSVSQGVSGSFPNPAEVPNSWKLSLSGFHIPRPKVLVSFLYSVFVFSFFSVTES